jgi:hypothetical protein
LVFYNLLQFKKNWKNTCYWVGPCEQCSPVGNIDRERFETSACPTRQWHRDRGAARTQRVPRPCQTSKQSVIRHRRAAPRSPTLSPLPIKGLGGRSFHPLVQFFPQCLGKLPPPIHRRLAAVLLHHYVIPSAWLINKNSGDLIFRWEGISSI